MPTPISTVLKNAARTLQDLGAVRWKTSHLVGYLNEGQLEINVQRPDATSSRVTVDLVAGAKQTAPATASKWLDVYANDTAGSKLAVTQLTDRRHLDAAEPGWRGAAGSAVIYHFWFDERDPTLIEVYPPATSAAKLDALLSLKPTVVTEPADSVMPADVSGNIFVPDEFSNVLRDFVIFRALSMETEQSLNIQAAQLYEGRYKAGMGIEIQATVAASPRAGPNA